MNNTIYLLLVALCAFVAPNGNGQELRMSDREKAVVQIALQKPDASISPIGTGFFVDDKGTIATALHVYTDAISALAQVRGGIILARRASRSTKRYTMAPVDILKADANHDLALLTLKDKRQEPWKDVGGIRPLSLATIKEIDPETEVTVIGYFGNDLFPLSLRARLVGAASVTIAPGTDVEEFLVSALAVPGQSGGPIVLEDGSVIGVIVSIVPVTVPFNTQPLPSGLSRAVKVEHLQRLLESK